MDASARQAALDRARQGDREAQAELLESFRPYVRVVARALGADRIQRRVDDSDLVQDALLEAHRSFGRFRGTQVAELVAWLRQVAIRSVGHALRHHLATGKRDAGREQPVASASGLRDESGSSPSAVAMRHEAAARVAEQVARLPEDMQQVVLGRHVDDLSYDEIAERLGRSNDAVRALYTRALRRLREQISP